MSNDNDNIFSIVKPGNPAEPAIPESDYVIIDVDGNELFAEGFLVFTSHHVAVMREIAGLGALPVLVVPLTRVMRAELVEDDEEDDEDSAPF